MAPVLEIGHTAIKFGWGFLVILGWLTFMIIGLSQSKKED